MLKLERPVEGGEPVPLYPLQDEQGRVVGIVGRGKTGTGITGPVGEKRSVALAATTLVDGASETLLLTIFDDPDQQGTDATELEGQGGQGDSGGPAFLEHDGKVHLAGVGSFGTGSNGRGRYGTVDGYIRVSSFRDWITRVLAEDPAAVLQWSPPNRYGGPSELAEVESAAQLPDTPVRRAATDLLTTLESGEVEALVGFLQRAGVPGGGDPEAMAGKLHSLVQAEYGPPRVFGWSTAGPTVLRFLFYSERKDTWRSIHLEVADTAPHRLATLFIKWESPPKPSVWR